MDYLTDWNEIIGRKINKIITEYDHTNLIFILDNNEKACFEAEGDCCSTSWIEHFDSPTEECTILEFKEIEIPPSFEEKYRKEDGYDEEIKYYFYELITDKGSFLIEMRNSSNGYYGGYLQYKGIAKCE